MDNYYMNEAKKQAEMSFCTRAKVGAVIVKDGAIIYNDTAPVIDSASTSTCEGFNIPLNKLTTGTVRVDINVTSGDRGGVISREISL